MKSAIVSLVFIVLLTSLTGCQSTRMEQKTETTLFLQERQGIKKYYAGDYQEAFELLSETATWGLKESQYFLAFMFMKGQYVEQSPVLGMAWLGVANEINRQDWHMQFDAFYQAATPEIQNRIDSKLQQYIAQYGMSTQNITCAMQTQIDSAKPKLRCNKGPGTTPLYPVELAE